MSDIRPRWWIRLGLVGCAVGLFAVNWAARRESPPTVSTNRPVAAAADVDHAGEPLLDNQTWHIRNMATAHGAFVIEVEAEDPTQTETIARALVEPIRNDYDEILVYVNKVGDESDLPARRMQWTPGGGYVEIAYDQPASER